MLNQTVFGSWEAREALQEGYMAGDIDEDWCVGGDGCRPWKKSKAGRKRYERLRTLWEDRNG